MIEVKKFTFNDFSENTYILSDETKSSIIIDPGCLYEKERNEILKYISDNELKVEKIVNTHCHLDHVFGNRFLKDTLNVPLAIPKDEIEVFNAAPLMSKAYGLPEVEVCEYDELIENEGQISFGNSSLEILYVPGHSPGHLAFYSAEDKFVINGDVLFFGGIGRTDLPGGNYNTLENSIRTKMYALPEDTKVYCGHGPETTIANEKQFNSFVRPE
ncbi:MBL fold metallo-hydrolase [Sediminitomix flava]|uniref:Glyoxylase-like metal-dependent hydrolase (Beta-lactamase superfamily II) n=1 Tax=Sediminitomix flava TaxID=379075 RepID=A0A315ZAS2_SEDFL|nr:MBL fold metallo-hydrolase [Sediminitomix flava]PWJ42153.1 glyoxylase-like metal-dependent hydrolase (beta-lactamase superfamily II) [Sediminitomix flava]